MIPENKKFDPFLLILLCILWIIQPISYEEMRSRHPIYSQENAVLVNRSSHYQRIVSIRGGSRDSSGEAAGYISSPVLNPRPLQDRPRTSGQSRSSENYPNPRVAHRPKYANQESSNGYPDFNGSGSDNDNNLNPDWITDPDKWDKIQESLSLGSKESEEDLDSSPPDHSCSSTSSLTKEELKKYPLLPMQPSYFKDWEGQDCSFRQAEGKRKVYTYGPVLGLDGDFAPCPPPSSTKVQRENCMVPTNENILELRDRFKSHVQSTNAEMAKFEAPCPYRSDQKARMYLNILTGECFYTHAEGKTDVMGKFWGFKQLTPAEIREYRREAIEAGTWRTPNSDYRDYTN